MKKKIIKLCNFYLIMTLMCLLVPCFTFNNELRGEFTIAASLFCIAYELSDKKPMIIEIERKE